MDYLILIVVIFLLLIFLNNFNCYEKFPFMVPSPPKRNMSYDLRCDPYIEKKNTGPFRESTIDHYYRPKCLELR